MNYEEQRILKKIPLEILFCDPEKTSPVLSPDGTRLAYLAPDAGLMNIWVRTLGQKDDRCVTKDRGNGIHEIYWSMDGKRILYLLDRQGDENWRLYGLDPDNGKTWNYTPFDDVSVVPKVFNRRHPGSIVVRMNKENPSLHDAYRLDLESGALELAAKNPGDVTSWFEDIDLQVRACMAGRKDGGAILRVRASEEAPWEDRIQWDPQDGPEDTESAIPCHFSLDGKFLFLVDGRNSPTNRFVRYDLATGDLKVLAEDPEVMVTWFRVDPETWEPEAVAFERSRLEWKALTPSFARAYEKIMAFIPGDIEAISRGASGGPWVLRCVQDDKPHAFYLYQPQKGEVELLFHSKPALLPYETAKMEPVSFKSRDGLTLHGYLTLPPGQGRKNLPLVLRVHGGPQERDGWRYASDVQWLANRGFACLQVNYRGSSGYTKVFMEAGVREWGGKMHEDLIDGVDWAVQQGLADPQRVGIYGISYGGYAALVGAAFTPDTFRCAIDLMGPVNLVTLVKTVPPYWKNYLASIHRMIGDPDKDRDFMMSRSPLSKVDRIKSPILMGYGANDPRCKPSEARQIVEAMRQRGIAHEYLLFPDEGHGFSKSENLLKFFRIAEGFLEQHMG